ncbi:hypothetical protein EXU57_24325 [Segetibacter sp. 3557_3]|uniref:hypothetical protein n=1 Tax=Segetibacter sp. 3557_3 TaxID=2547429 RepID=UPI001058E9A4|nr:hypothetical protein [Segetibacter sp. 3557_3]TDH18179.1 hypothetical protein EXU57_24325 [Segetibacter sp. 3557_3]
MIIFRTDVLFNAGICNRRWLTLLDLQWLYKRTAKYFRIKGQQSIDLVVFFKVILIGYLKKLASDRRIYQQNAGVPWRLHKGCEGDPARQSTKTFPALMHMDNTYTGEGGGFKTKKPWFSPKLLLKHFEKK